MKYLSICSGIEAATVAWHPLGWQPIGFSEIEAFPSAVLQHHYPTVPNFGDMTKFNEWTTGTEFRPDIIVGGTPCQAFSIAGLRGGLDDDRGNLALKYVEIVARYRPRWIIWENVPGVFSSAGGSDFASILGALSGRVIHPPVEGWRNSGTVEGIPDAYGLAWRTLDAQYFGVAQQRRRVFVVGYLGNWRRAAAALFETACLRRDTAPRRRTRPQTSRRTLQDAFGSGVAGTIGRSYEKGHGRTGGANGGVARGHLIPAAETSLCLNAGGMGRQDSETETMVAHLPDTTSALTASNGGADVKTAQARHCVAAPLTGSPYADRGAADESKLIPVGRSLIASNELARKCRALEAMIPTPIQPIPKPIPRANHPCIAFEPRDRGDDGRGYARPPAMLEDIAPTLNTVKPACVTPPEAYGFQTRIARNGRGDMGDIAHALTLEAGEDGRGDSAPCVAVTLHGSHERVRTEASPTELAKAITTSPPGESTNCSTTVAINRAGVRRLTCRECERLQGFPDDYTLIPWKNRRDPEDNAETVAYLTAAGYSREDAEKLADTPDGPRYKSIGNSMAVPVMRWIGERIAAVDKIPAAP